MTTTATILLLLLFIKHWYVDFVNQSYNEIVSKKIYGQWPGLYHSVKHGLATTACLVWWSPAFAVIVGLLETLIHYHIDWAKMNWGCSDQTNKLFWTHFGLDQLAHALTYIAIVWCAAHSVL